MLLHPLHLGRPHFIEDALLHPFILNSQDSLLFRQLYVYSLDFFNQIQILVVAIHEESKAQRWIQVFQVYHSGLLKVEFLGLKTVLFLKV